MRKKESKKKERKNKKEVRKQQERTPGYTDRILYVGHYTVYWTLYTRLYILYTEHCISFSPQMMHPDNGNGLKATIISPATIAVHSTLIKYFCPLWQEDGLSHYAVTEIYIFCLYQILALTLMFLYKFNDIYTDCFRNFI